MNLGNDNLCDPGIKCSDRRRWFTKSLYIRLLTLSGVVLAFFVRRPEAFVNPQFYAEDGAVLFKSCFNGDPSLFVAFPDTIQLIPRLIAYLASFAPVYFTPLFYNLFSLIVILFVANRVMNDRLDLPYKPLFSLLILIVPTSGEVFSNVANIQWITSILILLLIIQDNPKNALQAIGDLVILIIAGLTGPFIAILFPLILYRLYFKGANRFNFALIFISAIISLIQITYIFKNPSGYTEYAQLDIFSRIYAVAYRLGGILLFGDNLSKSLGMVIVSGAFVLLIVFIIISARKSTLKNYIILFMSSAFLFYMATFFRKGLIPKGFLMNFQNADRYFYIPRLMVIWTIALLLIHYSKYIKITSLILLIVMIFNSFLNYPVIKRMDMNWKFYSNLIDKNRGSPLVIPINPDTGWFIRLNIKESSKRTKKIITGGNFENQSLELPKSLKYNKSDKSEKLNKPEFIKRDNSFSKSKPNQPVKALKNPDIQAFSTSPNQKLTNPEFVSTPKD